IPIVFFVGVDPVKEGLVASLNRPDSNITGFTNLTGALGAKRLELLREVVSATSVLGVLLNPTSPFAGGELKEIEAAADAIGQNLFITNASSASDVEVAFSTIAKHHAGALLVGADPVFLSRRDQLIALAAHHAIPAIYSVREFAAAGGLISY